MLIWRVMPAATIVTGHITVIKGLSYIIAQLAGAVFGILLLVGLFPHTLVVLTLMPEPSQPDAGTQTRSAYLSGSCSPGHTCLDCYCAVLPLLHLGTQLGHTFRKVATSSPNLPVLSSASSCSSCP